MCNAATMDNNFANNDLAMYSPNVKTIEQINLKMQSLFTVFTLTVFNIEVDAVLLHLCVLVE